MKKTAIFFLFLLSCVHSGHAENLLSHAEDFAENLVSRDHPDTTQEYLEGKISTFNPRYTTMTLILNLMEERKPKILIETYAGKSCNESMASDAAISNIITTHIFGTWARWNECLMYSLDPNPRIIHDTKLSMEPDNKAVQFVCKDPAKFLKKFDQPIDMLYLGTPGLNNDNSLQAQQDHLKTIKAAYPNLHSNSIIMVNDAELPHGGKNVLVTPYLLEKGWKVYAAGYQVIFVKDVK